jgi:hypothetical protein
MLLAMFWGRVCKRTSNEHANAVEQLLRQSTTTQKHQVELLILNVQSTKTKIKSFSTNNEHHYLCTILE